MKAPTLFYVAEYIRLSREDGDKAESDSIGNQRKLIADYLKGKDDFVLYDTYVDDGFTGTNFKRPAFMRMIEDIFSDLEKSGRFHSAEAFFTFSLFMWDFIMRLTNSVTEILAKNFLSMV